MPTYYPYLTAEEKAALTNHIAPLVSALGLTCDSSTTSDSSTDADSSSPISIWDALSSSNSDPGFDPEFRAAAEEVYGYIEAFRDFILSNPLHNTFELQAIAAHSPTRAKGYADGVRDARSFLKAHFTTGKKGFPGDKSFDALGLIRF